MPRRVVRPQPREPGECFIASAPPLGLGHALCVFEMCVFEGRGRHVCVCDDDLSDGMCVMCVFDVYQGTRSVPKVVLRLERH